MQCTAVTPTPAGTWIVSLADQRRGTSRRTIARLQCVLRRADAIQLTAFSFVLTNSALTIPHIRVRRPPRGQKFGRQEAVLPQTDRATRRVSRNLAHRVASSMHNGVGTRHQSLIPYTTSSEQNNTNNGVIQCYSRPTYDKLVHSATTRSTVVGVIHKLTVDEFACTPTTCCGEIF